LCGPLVFTLEDPQQLSFLKYSNSQLSLEPIKQTAAGTYTDLRMKAAYEYRLDQIMLLMPIELEVIAPIVIEEKIEGDLIPDALDDNQTEEGGDGVLADGEADGDSESEGAETDES